MRSRRGASETHTTRRVKLTPSRLVILLGLLSTLVVWMNLRVVTNHALNTSHASISTDVTSASGGAAACLLVMDDNHMLPEWLSYHYHVLPLRYLVIAVDPRSKTRPTAVLQRWKNVANLTIVIWESDDQYMSGDELQQAEYYVARTFGQDVSPHLITHRARQRMFYFKCMQHLKQQNRHWTALIDTDEYLTLSYDTIARYGRDNVPGVVEPGSVLKFLNSELQRADAFRNITTPCIQIPRIRFGAKESEPAKVQQGVPPGLDGRSFQTLRWRMHVGEHNYGLNRISKSLLDLSRVPWQDLQPIDSIHRPIPNICGRRKLHIRKSEQVLVIHHYLGTYEQYSFRDDARLGKERSEKEYRKMQNVGQENDDVLRPWLQGFVDTMGHEAAKELTKGAGAIESGA